MQDESDERDLRKRAMDELGDAVAYAKELGAAKLKDGQWFLALLSKVNRAYDRNARAEYFQKKYPGLPRDEIADKLISVATRYAAIVGGATGAAATAGQIALPASGGVSAVTLIGGIGAEMLTLGAIQMRLVLDMATVYDLGLDAEDPEDALMVFGYALGVAPVELVGKGLKVPVRAVTTSAVKKYVSKGTLKTLQSAGKRVGVKILQRTVVKYAVPIASAGIGSAYNYVTTRSIGEIAKRHMRDRGKVTEELRAIVSRRVAYDLVVPAAVWFTAQADGRLTAKERELYKAMLTRMSVEEHMPEDFERLVADKEGLLEAVASIEDRDAVADLVELVVLMAIYDGALAPEERDWLVCVADRACVPLDIGEVERRAEEYQAVVREDIFKKTSGSVGKLFTRTTGSAERARQRLSSLLRGSAVEPGLEEG